MLHLLLAFSLVSGAGAGSMIDVLGSLLHSLGLRGDAASSTGSVHAKLADLKANPGSVINSIQRGTLAVSGATSNTATITSVTTSKALLSHVGQDFSQDNAVLTARLVLTNATTITGTRGTAAGTTTISYEVVEFK